MSNVITFGLDSYSTFTAIILYIISSDHRSTRETQSNNYQRCSTSFKTLSIYKKPIISHLRSAV